MSYVVTQEQYEILMKAAKALDEQGVRSIGPDNRGCLYRGPDDNKCFIGHIIPDEEYDVEMEDLCVADLIDTFGNVVKGFEGQENLKLLDHLQDHHDFGRLWKRERGDNPNAMQDYVKRIVEVV